MSFRRTVWCWLAALVVLLGGCATVPTEYREPPTLGATERMALNLRVFDRAWELVNDRYFDSAFRGADWGALRERYRPDAATAPDTDALYAVLNRMCAELKESHLAALAPRRVHELDTDHRLAVGIRWQLMEGRRVVSDVVPGGPADRAGIRRGWLLVSRNGAPLRDGESFRMRSGTAVTFGFLDANDAIRSYALQPELLNFERREASEFEGGIVCLRFDRFDRESLSWLSGQLKAHASAPAIVIDLRYNPGGNTLVLDMAVAEFFSQRVPIGRLVKRSGRASDTHSLAWLAARYPGKVALLTSAATASAAEIFAHVLQHHGRAPVVGQKTAGAVIYSRPYRLPDGGRIQIPVIDYIGLDGGRLEGRGVTPNIVVPPRSLADARADRDLEIAAALDVVRRGARPPAAAVGPAKP